MKFILKILFFIPILFISSCEDLENPPFNAEQFFGTWYATQNFEIYQNIVTNINQTIVPVESQLAGFRPFDGGIRVVGNGINDTLVYAFFDEYLMFSNKSAFLLASNFYGEIPSDYIALILNYESDAITLIIGENMYMGSANTTWHIDFANLFDIDANSDLRMLTLNGSNNLINILGETQNISLSGSLSFSVVDIQANTNIDMMEVLFGMPTAEFFPPMSETEDGEIGFPSMTLVVNEDSTYSLIEETGSFSQTGCCDEYGNDIDTSWTIYDTCSGSWNVIGNKFQIDFSNQVCTNDADDSDSDMGPSMNNYQLSINSNGNMELKMWDESYCSGNEMIIFGGGDYYDYYNDYQEQSEESCKSDMEDGLGLISNSITGFELGFVYEFSKTPNEILFDHPREYINRVKNISLKAKNKIDNQKSKNKFLSD